MRRELQEQKKYARQIYDGAVLMLGAKNDFEEEDETGGDQTAAE